MRSLIALMVGAILAAAPLTVPTARASPDPARTAIRIALLNWTAAFNARDTAHVCDLLAPDLRYDYQGSPERDYGALCALLRHTLDDPKRIFNYSPDIKEILVSGDLAVVRLIWTLKVTRPPVVGAAVSREVGLDVFRKQADGKWKIVRFMAYEDKPSPPSHRSIPWRRSIPGLHSA
ncbi:MAG: nuclear transport factor 2 family protein [Acetobacteraceae bacterium]